MLLFYSYSPFIGKDNKESLLYLIGVFSKENYYLPQGSSVNHKNIFHEIGTTNKIQNNVKIMSQKIQY